MAAQAFRQGDDGDEVLALQQALNRQAEQRFYPPLVTDHSLGPETASPFQAIGWALGFAEDVLKAPRDLRGGAQALIADSGRARRRPAPARTGPRPEAARAHDRLRRRADLLGAREAAAAGARARLGRHARELRPPRRRGRAVRPEVAGHPLRLLPARSQQLGRCPADCGGDCAPANPPGASSHEQLLGRQRLPRPGRPAARSGGSSASTSATPTSCSPILGDARLRGAAHVPEQPEGVPPPQLHRRSGPGAAERRRRRARRRDAALPVMLDAAPSRRKPAAAGATVTLTGPDVSQNQPDVDWAQVAAAGPHVCDRQGRRTVSARPTRSSARAAGRR